MAGRFVRDDFFEKFEVLLSRDIPIESLTNAMKGVLSALFPNVGMIEKILQFLSNQSGVSGLDEKAVAFS